MSIRNKRMPNLMNYVWSGIYFVKSINFEDNDWLLTNIFDNELGVGRRWATNSQHECYPTGE